MSDYKTNVQVNINGMSDLDKLESRLAEVKNTPIRLNIKATSGLSSVLSQLKEVQKIGKSISGMKIKIGTDSGGSSQIDAVTSKIGKIKKELASAKIDLNFSNAQTSMQSFGNTTTKTLEKAKQTLNQVKKDMVNLKLAPNDNIAMEYYDKVAEGLKKYQNQMKIAKNEAKEMGISLSASAKSFSTLDAVTASNKTMTWLKNNSRAVKEYGDTLTALAEKQRAATNSADLAKYTKEVNFIKSAASAAGKTGISFADNFKRGFSQIAQFVGVYGVLQKGVQIAGQMAREVVNVDTAMTELRKVSDAPSSQISSYFDQATVSAKKYGATISDVISSTADWSRLGKLCCPSR